MIPNMAVWRPCDTVESAVAWQQAIERKTGPSCLIFSRQDLPFQKRSDAQLAAITRGGYILGDCAGTPDAIIIATGSEVQLAMGAAEKLGNKKIRVVSMPSTTVFDAQDAAYRESVLPAAVTRRVAVEAARPRAGTSTWASMAAWSVSTASANRPRIRCCSRNSASPLRTWSRPWKRFCNQDSAIQ